MTSGGDSIFTIADYVVFTVTILACLGIGAFYTCANKTTDDYLIGNKQLKIIPVGISLMISYLSAITIIGYPAEMYYYGVEYWFFLVGYTISVAFTYFLFIPLLYPLNLISIHEYFYLRYHQKWMVYIACCLQIVAFTLYNGVVLFGPATMLVHFTGIPSWVSIVVTAAIATVYTTMGGFKAVIWSDVFQAVVVVGGLLAIVILGTIKVGSVSEVFKIYMENGRGNVRFTVDPTKRSTFWGYTVGIGLYFTSVFVVTQTSLQRYSSQPSLASAKKMLLVALPFNYIITSLACVSGIIAFSYYTSVGCDPYRSGAIDNMNQIIPHFIKDVLLYPAVPGIFTAAIFCGTVSSVSSCYNSSAALIWEDILKDKLEPLHLSEGRKSLINKGITVFAGILSAVSGLMMTQISGTLSQIISSLNSAMMTPLCVVLVLGALSPRTSWKVATIAGFVSFTVSLIISLGSVLFGGSKSDILPTTTENCTSAMTYSFNSSGYTSGIPTTSVQISHMNSTSPEEILSDTKSDTFILFRVAFVWFFAIGFVIGLAIGLLLTFIPGLREDVKTPPVDPKLLFPFVRKFIEVKEYKLYTVNHDGLFMGDNVKTYSSNMI